MANNKEHLNFHIRGILLFLLSFTSVCTLTADGDYKLKILRVNTENFPDAAFVEFTMTDASGNFVPNLQLSDFELWDNSAKMYGCRKLIQDMSEVKLPIDVVFLVDNSNSMKEPQEKVNAAIPIFLDGLKEKGDVRVGLVRFGHAGQWSLCPEYGLMETYGQKFFLPLQTKEDVELFGTIWARNTIDGGSEPYYEVLNWVAGKDFGYRKNALKVIVLLGDEDIVSHGNDKACNGTATYDDDTAIKSLLTQADVSSTLNRYGFQTFIIQRTIYHRDFEMITQATSGGLGDVESADYSNILTLISNKIKGRYIMRFCTDSAQAGAYCNEEERIITVEYKGDEASSGSSRYRVTRSASILRSPATRELDNARVDAGKPITLEIDVVPNGSTVDNVSLMYKAAADADFESITLSGSMGVVRGDTVRYTFTIPADAVSAPYIQYYVEADTYRMYDGVSGQQIKVSSPPYYRNDFSWNIAVKPYRVPMIEKIDEMPAYPCSVMEIKAYTDGMEPYTVALHYRMFGTPGEFQETAMSPSAVSGVYVGAIPKQAFVDNGVEYYVTARSGAGVTGRYGSSERPLFVQTNPTGATSRRKPMEIVFGSRESVMIGCESLADGDTIAAYYTSECDGYSTEYLMSKSAWNATSQNMRLTVYGESGAGRKDGYAEGDSIMLRLFKGGKDYELIGHDVRYSSTVGRIFFGGVTIGRQTPAVEIWDGGLNVTESGEVDFGVCESATERTVTVKNTGCEKLLILKSELDSDFFALETEADSIIVEPGGSFPLRVTYVPFDDCTDTLHLHTNTDEHSHQVTLTGRSKTHSACLGINVLQTATENGAEITLRLFPRQTVDADISLRSKCSKYAEWSVKMSFLPGESVLNLGNRMNGDYKISVYTTDGLCEYPLQIKR